MLTVKTRLKRFKLERALLAIGLHDTVLCSRRKCVYIFAYFQRLWETELKDRRLIKLVKEVSECPEFRQRHGYCCKFLVIVYFENK